MAKDPKDPRDPTAEPAVTQQRPKGKPRGKPWVKGQSGNPEGTSKSPPEVRAFLRELTMLAAQRLRDVLQRADAETKDIIAASRCVFDFALAKPSAEVATTAASGTMDEWVARQQALGSDEDDEE